MLTRVHRNDKKKPSSIPPEEDTNKIYKRTITKINFKTKIKYSGSRK
jgi:hypothetical protein